MNVDPKMAFNISIFDGRVYGWAIKGADKSLVKKVLSLTRDPPSPYPPFIRIQRKLGSNFGCSIGIILYASNR